jgi:peroxiredoxin
VELRASLADVDDLVVLYVLAESQVNDKTRRFVEELGLRQRIRFLVDPGSATIDAFGLRREDPEAIEVGVPHPATYVLDRQGIVRFADVRRDFHVWIASEIVAAAIHQIP